MPCQCCEVTDKTFGRDIARADLKRYRRRGPAKHTRLLLEAVEAQGVRDASVLDIGGGIGAIHHELLEGAARQATHVDASSAYLESAREEAARRQHTERVTFLHADFTDVAGDLPPADIVTLDRVVCCYPDYRALLGAAASHSRRVLGLTYPRERWYTRLGIAIGNAIQRLKRDPFLGFVHPVREMDALLRGLGFERVFLRDLFVWEVALYRRRTPPGEAGATS